jgi:hypothetical protein
MRQLHPVSFHERFVASGTYVWSQDGAPTGDVEHWTIHEPGAGAWTIRADYDGRAGSGTNWLFEGYFDRASRRVERFDMAVFEPRRMDAKFAFESGEARVSVRVDGVAADVQTVTLEPDAVLRPPALVCAWLFVAQPLADAPAFVPMLACIEDAVDCGAPDTFTVTELEPASITVDAQLFVARVWRVRTRGGEDVTLWFNHRDILLGCDSSTGRAARLTQYVHRPETTS